MPVPVALLDEDDNRRFDAAVPRNDPGPILVVEEDVEVAEGLGEHLEPQGFATEVCTNSATGLFRALRGRYRLVILGDMAPRLAGLETLRCLRTVSEVPVLLLAARGTVADRVAGFEAGADDCVSRPCDPQELVARVRAILRRATPALSADDGPVEVLTVADVVFDARARTVRRAGSHVDLTGTEFALLHVFLRSPGRVIDREELSREVLGREFSVFDRSIDNLVSQVRRKLGPDANGQTRIRGVRNRGYVYPAPERRIRAIGGFRS